MQACAEDLGAVPSFVRDSIHENKIIGLDIIRWTRSFEDGSYIPADKYRPLAVSSLSVHDTSIALDWWNTASHEDQKAFRKLIHLKATHNDPSEIARAMLRFAFSTNSLFSINLLHDFVFDSSFFLKRLLPIICFIIRKDIELMFREHRKIRIGLIDFLSTWKTYLQMCGIWKKSALC